MRRTHFISQTNHTHSQWPYLRIYTSMIFVASLESVFCRKLRNLTPSLLVQSDSDRRLSKAFLASEYTYQCLKTCGTLFRHFIKTTARITLGVFAALAPRADGVNTASRDFPLLMCNQRGHPFDLTHSLATSNSLQPVPRKVDPLTLCSTSFLIMICGSIRTNTMSENRDLCRLSTATSNSSRLQDQGSSDPKECSAMVARWDEKVSRTQQARHSTFRKLEWAVQKAIVGRCGRLNVILAIDRG